MKNQKGNVIINKTTTEYKGIKYDCIDGDGPAIISASVKIGPQHISIYIDPKSGLAKYIVKYEYDAENIKRIKRISSEEFDYNPKLSDEMFVFTPPEGATEMK